MEGSAETTLSSSLLSEAAQSPSPVRFARRVRTGCVWPANYRNSSQRTALLGRTYPQRMTLVGCRAGALDCAWPGWLSASLGPEGTVLLPLESGLRFDRSQERIPSYLSSRGTKRAANSHDCFDGKTLLLKIP
jgi:hypothetical protein